jgi:hypothetical protein
MDVERAVALYKELHALAKVLNDQRDDFMANMESIEAAFQRLDLGIEVSVGENETLFGFGPKPWPAHHSQKWRLFTKYGLWETSPLEVRLATAERIPDLLEAMVAWIPAQQERIQKALDVTEEIGAALRSGVEEIMTIIEAMRVVTEMCLVDCASCGYKRQRTEAQLKAIDMVKAFASYLEKPSKEEKNVGT